MELRYDPKQFWQVGMKCCQIYYQMGFQVVFAVHWEQSKRYHIHFAVNSINFVNGHKWHSSLSLKELDQREGASPLEKLHIRNEIFNQILFEHQMMINGTCMPLYFVDTPFSVQPVSG